MLSNKTRNRREEAESSHQPATLRLTNKAVPQTDEAPAETDIKGTAAEPVNPSQRRRKFFITAGAIVLLLAMSVGGYQWFRYLSAYQETDDAYTTGHMHAISSRINDTVLKVLVDDNEHVKAGQVLVLLDPADYQVKVDQALSALKTAQNQAQAAKVTISVTDTTASGKTTEAAGEVSNAQSGIQKAIAAVSEARAAVPQAQAELAQKRAEEQRSSLDYQRYDNLARQGAVSVQQRDQALRDYRVATEASKAAQQSVNQAAARLQQAQDAVNTARAQLVQSKGLLEQAKATHLQTQVDTSQYEVAQSAIDQATAQLHDAQLQLSYTKIVAPADGRIGKKSVEDGQRVQPGQELMALVGDDMWVVANFKETQLEQMRPNEPVEIKIDSFPHHTFTGKLNSVSPGSGASFALLPPDNATGNFTKIVQRVPVKIVFDADSIKGFENLLVPGMSAMVNVKVGR